MGLWDVLGANPNVDQKKRKKKVLSFRKEKKKNLDVEKA